MDKPKWLRALRFMVLGATSFWFPDTLLHAIRRYNFSRWDITTISAVMPLTLLCTFIAVKRTHKSGSPRSVGLPMLAGVWLFGGLFITVGASFSGGGFMSPQGLRWVVTTMLLSLLPPYTFIMATYDGALLSLLLVTIAAFLVRIVQLIGVPGRLSRQSDI